MDDTDDGLPALAPQWLTAGKPTGASGGGAQEPAAQDTDTRRQQSRRQTPSNHTQPLRSKAASISSSWRSDNHQQPGSSKALAHTKSLPSSSYDHKPAVQPAARPAAKAFDKTFPHLTSARTSVAAAPQSRPPVQSVWNANAANAVNGIDGVSAKDNSWTSRLAQPAEAAKQPQPAHMQGKEAMRPSGHAPEPTPTARLSRPLVPIVAAPRSSQEHGSASSHLRSSGSGLTNARLPAGGARSRAIKAAKPNAGKPRDTIADPSDRNSFFQSLRTKASSQPHNPSANPNPALSSTLSSSTASGLSELAEASATLSASAASVPPSRQTSLDAIEATEGSRKDSGEAAAASRKDESCSAPQANGVCSANGNGLHKEEVQKHSTASALELYESQLLAQEEAFLRSLGWQEESDDDAPGGLTEEEIAAFQAQLKNTSLHLPTANVSS
ncbi:hypothetical protein WJX73_006935 [Symbiochloris irregularis]|uniref:Uncharacterized protein n=1 Tax=Symbiochloris irregularis TaxID=706552 RepID=A0AAW1NMV6_9CHLO